LIRVRLLPECNPDWASLVINGPPGREYIARVRTQQVGQANVNGTKLAAMPIPLPPIDEQTRIIAALEQHLSAASVIALSVERASRRAITLRASILGRAFCGQLVPQDPDDQPAALLLEEISAERPATMAKRPRSVTP
jgi:type I restriction enzyme S subunit